FESGDDVPAAMRAALGEAAEPYLERRGPKWHVDLEGLNRQWLLRAGVLPENIETSGLCTACRRDLFWSHRKQGEARGVQCGAITAGME
ncbi:MAG: polyphenol oxidase family protein, partial [Dysosmobacter sp.]|nr:polyphenol oxidase family protein [Dysosmobacter sp.]